MHVILPCHGVLKILEIGCAVCQRNILDRQPGRHRCVLVCKGKPIGQHMRRSVVGKRNRPGICVLEKYDAVSIAPGSLQQAMGLCNILAPVRFGEIGCNGIELYLFCPLGPGQLRQQGHMGHTGQRCTVGIRQGHRPLVFNEQCRLDRTVGIDRRRLGHVSCLLQKLGNRGVKRCLFHSHALSFLSAMHPLGTGSLLLSRRCHGFLYIV